MDLSKELLKNGPEEGQNNRKNGIGNRKSSNYAVSHLTKMAPVHVEFNDLNYSVPTGRKGLQYSSPF